MDLETFDFLLRFVLISLGLVISGHYFCAANAIGRAPMFVKVLLMPCAVFSGIFMARAAWIGDVTTSLLCLLPAAICMITTELIVWRAGAYISVAFERQARERGAKKCRL